MNMNIRLSSACRFMNMNIVSLMIVLSSRFYVWWEWKLWYGIYSHGNYDFYLRVYALPYTLCTVSFTGTLSLCTISFKGMSAKKVRNPLYSHLNRYVISGILYIITCTVSCTCHNRLYSHLHRYIIPCTVSYTDTYNPLFCHLYRS